MVDDILQNSLDSLIYPLFVKGGTGIKEGVISMPGIYRFSVDTLVEEVGRLKTRGLNKILLFGVSEGKDEHGTLAYADDNIVSNAVKLIKEYFPRTVIMTDVCLCAYTSHGHCGILKNTGRGVDVDKEKTLSALAKMSVSHAASGADYVAPSAMAEQQVRVIRDGLDEKGYNKTKIMGYSAKFASQFYGPFRDIADSAPRFGDRRGYQLCHTDRACALREIEEDITEGADIVMVKPALGYLDIVREVKDKFNYPTAVYNVSGEYAIVKAGVKLGYWDEREIVTEIISGLKRAGADRIITYHARDIADWLKKG